VLIAYHPSEPPAEVKTVYTHSERTVWLEASGGKRECRCGDFG